jgi:hypothetical protein
MASPDLHHSPSAIVAIAELPGGHMCRALELLDVVVLIALINDLPDPIQSVIPFACALHRDDDSSLPQNELQILNASYKHKRLEHGAHNVVTFVSEKP